MWNHFWRNTKSSKEIVYPSIPILYFGDRDACIKSRIKIVTVGLNPSFNEFPSDRPFARFPTANSLLINQGTIPKYETYQKILNQYFTDGALPYKSWFSSFEPILNGLNASYYKTKGNTALHTDICTPLATRTTWSDLKRTLSQKGLNSLKKEGTEIWHSLINELKPDTILISVAHSYLGEIKFPKRVPWSLLSRIETNKKGEKRNPYDIIFSRLALKDKESLIVFGRAAQKPFSLISDLQKIAIGKMIAEIVSAI